MTAPVPAPHAVAPLRDDRRIVLVVAILASFVVGLDSSVVNVALPAIRQELGGGLVVQQWVVDAYLVTLGSLILVAGSLSDLFGRVRIITWGLVVFGIASVACAVAPAGEVLIVARALQGVGGALVMPSALALIVAAFRGAAQAKAIGTWTAWSSAATILGPVAGGLVVDGIGWRWIFVLTAVPIAVTIPLVLRITGEVHPVVRPRIDVVGALLAVVGVGGVVLGLIEQERLGWGSPVVVAALVLGAAALVAFVPWELRVTRTAGSPLVPLELFRARNFTVGNLATLSIYGALGMVFFVVTLFLQEVWRFPAWLAGLATLPPTIMLLVLSTAVGSFAGRYGPRWFMAAGPAVGAVGALLLLFAGDDPDGYWWSVFPGLVLIGVGIALMVTPLTSAVLGSVPQSEAGSGSAVNNAFARIAGLVTVALAGVVLGGEVSVEGLHRAMVVMALLLLAGAVVCAVGIRNTPART
ncbi:MFS transporter [Curtobacterium sp. MCBA15_007]|uniref:MFS transporter n=1 Tax=Curtobacterium poinsettiae TaxID=159612 RepID=A0ABT3S6I8_9MICO|nr:MULTISPECIES: MFS transporter [Curtobacterium]MBT1611261.1 MFS transporter [Curtobacterium flaccumfaciens pv. poinsettiae]MCS6577725.1 MFS transporter [Curtobacterium flaccumfaciens]MCX2849841.1 MFS transporter [Curtobacterium flaccumfaciens pv. poinsettiae]MDQ0538816.1 EmrB/QacA subfamily drug resistance transporter [Curtobacterium flaccumfaciens]OII08891.1 MFS transporter [Curtobacterium sp. MCBA15_007]